MIRNRRCDSRKSTKYNDTKELKNLITAGGRERDYSCSLSRTFWVKAAKISAQNSVKDTGRNSGRHTMVILLFPLL